MFLMRARSIIKRISSGRVPAIFCCVCRSCPASIPLIRDGVIAYDLFGEYPCFSSIHKSGSELYAPYFLSNYSLNIRNNIVMNPSEVRYRLLQKTNGYLISKPISEE